jgi:hypothetical protein
LTRWYPKGAARAIETGGHVVAVRAYEPGDLDLIDALPAFRAERAREPDWAPSDGLAWTLLRDGQPVGCAGVEIDSDGHGQLWSYLSQLGQREWVFAGVYVRAVLKALALPAYCAMCWASAEKAMPYLSRLGFDRIATETLGEGDIHHMQRRG